MVRRLMLAVFLGAIAVHHAVPLAAGQGAPPSAATEATKPEVFLTLVDPNEKVCVWQDLRLQFSLINGNLPSGIGVKSLSISLPPTMALLSKEGKVQIIPDRIPAFNVETPGERLDLDPVEIAGKRCWDLGFSMFSVLTYRPRKEVFIATLNYEGLKDQKLGSKSARLEVNVTAHPFGMYAGAILGSFLAAVFLMLPPIRAAGKSAAEAPPAEAATQVQRWRDFWIRFIRGAVVTGITILILQTTSEFALPINITVHDFYGGVLLGLFGEKLAAAISQWIWGA